VLESGFPVSSFTLATERDKGIDLLHSAHLPSAYFCILLSSHWVILCLWKSGVMTFSCSRFFRFIHIGQSVLEENTVIIVEKEASNVVIPDICCIIHYSAKCSEQCRICCQHV
jgi:hypothetical protein